MKRATPRGGIYLVTDPGLSMARIGAPYLPDSNDWYQQAISETLKTCKAAADAGVTTIQLRWKNVDAWYLYQLAQEVWDILRNTHVQIVINDRVDVFLALQTQGIYVHGVHIGQTDIHPRIVRDLIGERPFIGYSAATPQELQEANELDVIDWIGLGVVHATATKTDAPKSLGIDGMIAAAGTARLPVTAIGGIGKSDVAALAGNVHSAAVVSAIVSAASPYEAAHELVSTWNAAA